MKGNFLLVPIWLQEWITPAFDAWRSYPMNEKLRDTELETVRDIHMVNSWAGAASCSIIRVYTGVTIQLPFSYGMSYSLEVLVWAGAKSKIAQPCSLTSGLLLSGQRLELPALPCREVRPYQALHLIIPACVALAEHCCPQFSMCSLCVCLAKSTYKFAMSFDANGVVNSISTPSGSL